MTQPYKAQYTIQLRIRIPLKRRPQQPKDPKTPKLENKDPYLST